MMNHGAFGVALAIAVVATGCRTTPPGGDPPVIGPDVMEAVRTEGDADVMIALVPPDGYDAARADRPSVQEAIARLQDEVLGSLGPEDFRLRHRFTSVPALSGTVLTERGVRLLSRHPRVARVDLDEGGGGGAP